MKLEIDKKNNKVIINGISYPPTQHNLDVVNKFRSGGDEEVLKSLSTVVLDIK